MEVVSLFFIQTLNLKPKKNEKNNFTDFNFRSFSLFM